MGHRYADVMQHFSNPVIATNEKIIQLNKDKTILAIFDLQVTPMSPTKFGVNWPFSAGEEAKYRFSRWRPWWPSGISDQNNFSYI